MRCSIKFKDQRMVKITTLIDNHALSGSDLEAEHGFASFIEVGKTKILFDTGSGDAFIRNAKRLGVDLSYIDHLIISHSHYDHTGGVKPLFNTFSYKNLHMWTGMGFEEPKYSQDVDELRYLGADFDYKFISSNNVMWHTLCSDTVMISRGVWLVTAFEENHPIEKPNERFVVKRKDKIVQDDFRDEIALVIDSSKGLIMVVGCSHPGILNMIDTVTSRFAKPIYLLMGGIHLFDVSEKRQTYVIDELLRNKINCLGVSHCTGEEATKILKKSHKGFFINQGGVVTTIDSK